VEGRAGSPDPFRWSDLAAPVVSETLAALGVEMTDLTTPELAQRIDRLTDRINELRNAVQGRGVDPLGSKQLAAAVNDAQANWDEVRAKLLENAAAQMVSHPFDSAQTIENWEKLYNRLVDQAAAEHLATEAQKLDVAHTTTPGDILAGTEHAIDSAAGALEALAKAGLVFGGIWLIAKIWPRGRR
jgi:hypothetical protein